MVEVRLLYFLTSVEPALRAPILPLVGSARPPTQ
jgi:hypothetical protein